MGRRSARAAYDAIDPKRTFRPVPQNGQFRGKEVENRRAQRCAPKYQAAVHDAMPTTRQIGRDTNASCAAAGRASAGNVAP
jgi:hypothetical protein